MIFDFRLRARFVFERRVQDVSRSMRRECFRGKALYATEQEFVEPLVSAR